MIVPCTADRYGQDGSAQTADCFEIADCKHIVRMVQQIRGLGKDCAHGGGKRGRIAAPAGKDAFQNTLKSSGGGFKQISRAPEQRKVVRFHTESQMRCSEP